MDMDHANNDVANNDERINLLCHNCGKTFSAFLHQMADQNAKVVCPDCLASQDCVPPRTAARI